LITEERVIAAWAIVMFACTGGIIYGIVAGEYQAIALIFLMVIVTMIAGNILLDLKDRRDH
jgi:hypothetical protein